MIKIKKIISLLLCLLIVFIVPVTSAEETKLQNQSFSEKKLNFLEYLGLDQDTEEIVLKPQRKIFSVKEQKAKWTICIYLCATDLESNYSSATYDLLEMIEADIPEDINVLVLTGGTKTWDPFGDGVGAEGYIKPDNTKTQIYKITDSGMELVENLVVNGTTGNMGDPLTLAKFLQFSIENYPAEKIMVDIWNHGGGPLSGAAYDECTDDILSLLEFKAAFDAIEDYRIEMDGGNPDTDNFNIDLLGFDACLMSNMETAAIFSSSVDYMVASEETEPGDGWYYTEWLNALNKNSSMSAENLGKEIIDAYAYSMNSDGNWSEVMGETLALLNLTKMDFLLTSFENMAIELTEKMNSEDKSIYTEIIRNAENVQEMQEGYGLLDLYDFANDLSPYLDTADELISVLGTPPGNTPEHFVGNINGDGVVVYRGTGFFLNDCIGLAFFYPTSNVFVEYTNLENIELYTGIYRDLGISDTYSDYLYNVLALVNDMQTFDGEMAVSFSEEEYHYQLTVTKPTAVKKVEYYSFQTKYNDDNSSSTYFLGKNKVDSDWENGIFTEKFDGNWFTVNGQIATMNIEKYNDIWDMITLPVVVAADGKDLLSNMTIYKNNDGNYAYIDHITSPSGPNGANRTHIPDLDMKIHTVLMEYDIEAKAYTGNYFKNEVIELNNNLEEIYSTVDIETEELKSGQNFMYNGYFCLTDLKENTFFSDPCYYVIISDLSEMILENIPVQAYTGNEVKPTVHLLFWEDELLTEGIDYEVIYFDNIDIGTAKVQIKPLTEDITGEINAEFTIAEKTWEDYEYTVQISESRDILDFKIRNRKAFDAEMALITAVFSADGKLISLLSATDEKLTPNDYFKDSFILKEPFPDGAVLKVFKWNSLKEMIPISGDVKTINL